MLEDPANPDRDARGPTEDREGVRALRGGEPAEAPCVDRQAQGGDAGGEEVKSSPRLCGHAPCGKVLTGRQRRFCTRKCGWNFRDAKKPRKHATPEALAIPRACDFCSGPIAPERLRFALGKGKNLFCSEEHRAEFWNKKNLENHLLEVYGTKTPQPKKCEYPKCAKEFIPRRNSTRKVRRYCMPLCCRRDRGRKKLLKKYGPSGKPASVKCAYEYCGKTLVRIRIGHNDRIYCNSGCRRRDLVMLMHPDCDVCEKPINRRKRPIATTCSKACKREKAALVKKLNRERADTRERLDQ